MSKLVSIFRAFIYALVIVLGLGIAADQLSAGYSDNYFNLVGIVAFILVLEILTAWLQTRAGGQTHLSTNRGYGQLLQWAHHLILPILAYFFTAWFVYFYPAMRERMIVSALTLTVFTILFVNLRSYFTHDLVSERNTHYVYDLIKIYLVFLIVVVELKIFAGQAFGAFLAIVIVTFVFSILSAGRKTKVIRFIYLLCFTLALICGTAGIVLSRLDNFSPLKIAGFVTLVYYLGNATLHHYLHKELKRELVLEYALMVMLTLSILSNIN